MIRQDRMSGLLEAIEASPRKGRRRIVALVGAPASGKSTLATTLAARLSDRGHQTQIVPMDGFHISNSVLQSRGLLDRKGAPETFDLNGFRDLLPRMANDAEAFFPVFDRQMDVAIVAGGALTSDTDTVIVEGNYLLLRDPGWSDLHPYWDLSIALDIPRPVLRERLIARWVHFGLGPEAAKTRAETNDMANAEHVLSASVAADIVFSSSPKVTPQEHRIPTP